MLCRAADFVDAGVLVLTSEHEWQLKAAESEALRTRIRKTSGLGDLSRAHLKRDQGPLAAEMAMMRELVTQLNAIGVGLNHLVRAANEGAVWAGGIKEILEQTLSEFEKPGLRLTKFGERPAKAGSQMMENRICVSVFPA